MTASNIGSQFEKPSKATVFRPFLWAGLLILALSAIRAHQYLSEQTFITFQTLLAGSTDASITAECDGTQISSPAQLSLGTHRVIFRHPNGRTLSTNFFLFYGERKLGRINLERAMGTLNVFSDPVPRQLSIRGENFQTNLTATAQFSRSIPTGNYIIEANFLHHSERQSANIVDGGVTIASIAPDVGAIDLHSNVEGAKFRLEDEKDVVFAEGSLPAVVAELPFGTYRVFAEHHDHKWQKAVQISKRLTNTTEIKFEYGAVSFNSTPSGVEVVSEDGRSLGRTPLVLTEVEPGVKKMSLRLDTFQPVGLSIEVKAGETNRVTQKLVRAAYATAMSEGETALSNGAFDRAIESFERALRTEPDDSKAKSLLGDAMRVRALELAERFGNQGNFKAGIAELEPIVAVHSNDSNVVRLLTEYRAQDAARGAINEENRVNRAKGLLVSVLAKEPYADLFEQHELVLKGAFQQTETAIEDALKIPPGFRDIQRVFYDGDAFKIIATQEFKTALQTSAGHRRAVIVGAELKKGETTVRFKVFEFGVEAVNKFSVGNLIGAPVAVNYVPIRPSDNADPGDKMQARIKEGIQLVTERISHAIKE